jgi:hypothetical protein
MNKSPTFKIILGLALLQGILGLLRAYNWVQLGIDLFGQGLLLLPVVGTMAIMRGLIISAVALLYLLSVVGALLGKSWAWWTSFVAAVLNLMIVLRAFVGGAPLAQAAAWSVIPVILLFYLFSGSRRDALDTV